MNRGKKALSLALATMLSFGAAIASYAEMPKMTVVIGEKAYALDYANKAANIAEIQKQIQVARNATPKQGIYIKTPTGEWYDAIESKKVEKTVLPAVVYKDKEGVETSYGPEDGDEIPSVDVKVESVKVISATTINVTFKEAPAAPLKVEDFEKMGVNGAKVISVLPASADNKVYALTVEPLLGKGTVTIAGVSADYDFPVVAMETGVQSVTLDNYRHITVKFAKEVDSQSAADPKNYYFELVQGSVGEKLGAAQMDANEHYSLASIKNGGVKAASITVYGKDGKEVTPGPDAKVMEARISFKNDARLGNLKTGAITEASIIKILKLRGLTPNEEDKLLKEDVRVFLSTRNFTENGKKVFDTSVNEILIKDEKAPELLSVKDKEDKELDYTKQPFELNYAGDQKLVLEYNEPIGVKDEAGSELLPMNVSVRVNGKHIAPLTAAGAEVKVKALDYGDAKLVEINLAKLAAKAGDANLFAPNAFATIDIQGMPDVAGNLAQPLTLKFKVINPLDDTNITIKPAAIVDVKQVKDNMFVVFANRPDVTGILEIVNGDESGASAEAVIPYTRFEVRDYKVNPKDENEVPQKVYASFVQIETTGLVDSAKTQLSYDKQTKINRTVKVKLPTIISDKAGVIADENKKVADWQKTNFPIVMDSLGPVYVAEDADSSGMKDLTPEVAAAKLSVPVADVVPESYWKNDKNKYDVIPNLEDGTGTNEAALAAGEAFVGTGSLYVSYTKDDGEKVMQTVELTFKHSGTNTALNNLQVTTTNTDPVYLENGKLFVNLKKLKDDAALPAEFLTTSDELVKGATYKLMLPEALLADEKYAAAGNDISGVADMNNLKDPVAGAARENRVAEYAKAYGDGTTTLAETGLINLFELYLHSARTTKRGIVSPKDQFDVSIPKDPGAGPAPKQVPQTSTHKDAVKYIEATQQLKILFTGEPTEESLKDLKNYSLNGQTFESLGAKPEDVLITNATAADTIEGVQVNYVVRIKMPKNSVKFDGPHSVTIENVAHADGGKMARVFIPALDGFKDNTSPAVVNATFNASGKITLTFDEALGLMGSASLDSAKRNFKVEINGVNMTIQALGIDNNKLTLDTGADLTADSKVKVTIQNNTEGIMEVRDERGNTVDPEYSTNKDIVLVFE